MARKRNYQAEYRRRLERGRKLGLSKAQARGHPRRGEPLASSPAAKPQADEQITYAIRLMHSGASMTAAARAASMSSKRLRRFILAYRVARYEGRKWVMTDRLLRQMPLIERSSTKVVVLEDFKSASKVGKYHNAVGEFARTGEIINLDEFRGKGVRDAKGRLHLFETDPNQLLRYAAKDEPPFHEIYQIVSN